MNIQDKLIDGGRRSWLPAFHGKKHGFSGVFLVNRKLNWGLFLLVLAGFILVTPAMAKQEVLSAIKFPPGATYVGTETCATCHEDAQREFNLSTHSRIDMRDIPEGMAQGCEMCHGPGSVHVENGGGKDNIMSPRKNPELCFSCHTDKRAEFRLPFHHPVTEGKMACADCHNSHGPDAIPGTTAYLDDVNETCFKCHGEQRGPFVWEHEAVREGCLTCHKVHGSVNQKMLIARDNNLCLRCHTQVAFPTIGRSNHGTRMPQGSCFSAGCHTAVHGSNFDDHLRY